MRAVAKKSLAAARGALVALRAIRLESSLASYRVARVAEMALADSDAKWSPEERAALAALLATGPRGAPADDRARARLLALLGEFGVTQGQLAALAGVDRGTVAHWLTGVKVIPRTRARWIESVARIEVTRDRVVVTLRR